MSRPLHGRADPRPVPRIGKRSVPLIEYHSSYECNTIRCRGSRRSERAGAAGQPAYRARSARYEPRRRDGRGRQEQSSSLGSQHRCLASHESEYCASMKRRPTKRAPPDSFETVRAVGLALPDVEATIKYDRSPVLKARGSFMAGLATHRSAEPQTLVVRLHRSAVRPACGEMTCRRGRQSAMSRGESGHSRRMNQRPLTFVNFTSFSWSVATAISPVIFTF